MNAITIYNYYYYDLYWDTINVPGSEDHLRLGSVHQQMVEGLEFPHSFMCMCACAVQRTGKH